MDVSLEQLERFGYTAVIMLFVVLPVLWLVMRRVVSQMSDRDLALKEQREAHNAERKLMVEMFQKQITEERSYSAGKDARNSALNDRIYEVSQTMVAQAQKHAESQLAAVASIRAELQSELVSLGVRMRVAEATAERAERDASEAKRSDAECRRRLAAVELRIDTQERHTVSGA